jgi:hypothetical protein
VRAFLPRRGRPLATAVAALLAAAPLVGVPVASADIGIERVSRTSGVAGDRIELLIGCGGCLPRTIRLPISLLPAGDAPWRHPCRGTSCASRAPAPPSSSPYVPVGVAGPLDGGARLARRLGLEIPDSVRRRGRDAIRLWVASTNRLRFRIPDVDPGLYTYVIFCCGVDPPHGGDLLGHPNRRADRNRARLADARMHGEFLRIRPGASQVDNAWPPAWSLWVAGAVLISIVLAGAWRRSRP